MAPSAILDTISLIIQHVCQGGHSGLRLWAPLFASNLQGWPKQGGRWGLWHQHRWHVLGLNDRLPVNDMRLMRWSLTSYTLTLISVIVFSVSRSTFTFATRATRRCWRSFRPGTAGMWASRPRSACWRTYSSGTRTGRASSGPESRASTSSPVVRKNLCQ